MCALVYTQHFVGMCVYVVYGWCVGTMCMCCLCMYECMHLVTMHFNLVVVVLCVVCCVVYNITRLTCPLSVSGDGVPHELPSVSVSV